MTIRETWFECRFTSAHDRLTDVVLAWDAREAAETFRTELADRELELTEPGTIEVIGRDGELRLVFEPPPREGASVTLSD